MQTAESHRLTVTVLHVLLINLLCSLFQLVLSKKLITKRVKIDTLLHAFAHIYCDL